MRKFGLLALGLVLLGAALGTFGYRWIYEPQRAARVVQQAPQGAARGLQGPADARQRPQGGAQKQTQTQVSGFQVFEIALNVANVLVGLIGIWLAVRSVRGSPRGSEAAFRDDRR